MSAELTAERARELLDYDLDTGVLTWRHLDPPRFWHGKPAGTLRRTGYVRISLQGRQHQIHRVVWLWVHGEWPKDQIDHINRIKHDNRIENLRDVSPKENSANRPLSAGRPSNLPGSTVVHAGLRGYVSWHKTQRRWVGQALVGGKQTHLGTFKTREEALAMLPNALSRASGQQQKS